MNNLVRRLTTLQPPPTLLTVERIPHWHAPRTERFVVTRLSQATRDDEFESEVEGPCHDRIAGVVGPGIGGSDEASACVERYRALVRLSNVEFDAAKAGIA